MEEDEDEDEDEEEGIGRGLPRVLKVRGRSRLGDSTTRR
jgi:hypothetical protein